MDPTRLTLAISDYDHVRDLVSGEVRVPGIELSHVRLPVEEIFRRFIATREWDVAEMSMGKYAALVARGGSAMTALPVFPSRVFRQSAIFVRRDGPVRTPADLPGRRIGIPEWAQTAVIYARAFLLHEHGLRLQDVTWVQGGIDRPGGAEKVAVSLPPGVRLEACADRPLDTLLVTGELDALIAAHPPRSFLDGRPNIVRLIADTRAEAQRYWARTGIFPIMHVIALRVDTLHRDPGIAARLYAGFLESKERSVARMSDIAASRYPLPLVAEIAEEARARFGADPWPYGVAKNRHTLDAFVRFAHEQGVCSRPIGVDELFPPAMLST